jgi:hypothetical protein
MVQPQCDHIAWHHVRCKVQLRCVGEGLVGYDNAAAAILCVDQITAQRLHVPGIELEILYGFYCSEDAASLAVGLASQKDVVTSGEEISLQARRAGVGEAYVNEDRRLHIRGGPYLPRSSIILRGLTEGHPRLRELTEGRYPYARGPAEPEPGPREAYSDLLLRVQPDRWNGSAPIGGLFQKNLGRIAKWTG